MARQQMHPIDQSATSVLRTLRAYLPAQPISLRTGLLVTERLASGLLQLYAIEQMPVPVAVIADLPRVRVEVDRTMPGFTSGTSAWDSRCACWVITVNGLEPVERQRLTVFHEFFHIITHPAVEAGLLRNLSYDEVERLADYFAGCVLIPKRFLARAWSSGIQSPAELAEFFAASPRAVAVRLSQTRLATINTAPTSWTTRGAA